VPFFFGIYLSPLLLKSKIINMELSRIKCASGIAVPVVPLNFKMDGFWEKDTPFR